MTASSECHAQRLRDRAQSSTAKRQRGHIGKQRLDQPFEIRLTRLD